MILYSEMNNHKTKGKFTLKPKNWEENIQIILKNIQGQIIMTISGKGKNLLF